MGLSEASGSGYDITYNERYQKNLRMLTNSLFYIQNN